MQVVGQKKRSPWTWSEFCLHKSVLCFLAWRRFVKPEAEGGQRSARPIWMCRLPNYAPAPSPWIFGTSSKYRNTLLHVVFHGCYGKKCLPSNPITIVTYRTLEMYPKRSKMKKIGMVVDIFWFCLYQSTNILFSLSSTSQMLYKSRKTCLLAFCPASNQGVKFNTSGMSCLAQRCIITVQDIWSSLKCP